MLFNCLSVGIGGFFGSILRYLMGLIPIREHGAFPVNTLLINCLGALVIGVVIALSSRHQSIDPRWVLLLKVGFCGGFTTFSTFSAETLSLMQSGKTGLAVLYALLSVVLCAAAVFAGQSIVKALS